MNYLLIKPLILSLIISLVFTPFVISFFRKKGWVEIPQKNKHPKVIHTRPVPRGGGISIFLAIVIATLAFLPADSRLIAILLAALINLIVGLIDDLYDIHPLIRLATNVVSALIIIAGGIGIAAVTNPLGGVIHLDEPQLEFLFLGQVRHLWLLSSLFTVIWVVWCMNVVSWSGGVEGQLPGFVAIASAIIGILSLRFSQDITQWPVIILAGAISGAYLGFLFFNIYPQKIMPGYSGKSLAGFFLAVLSILSGAKVATAVLVLAVPMIDGIITITRRILAGKSPFWGDAEHLHHLLLKAGFSKQLIAVLYWLFSLIFGLIVLGLNSKQKLYAFIMLVIIIGGGVWAIRRFVTRKENG